MLKSQKLRRNLFYFFLLLGLSSWESAFSKDKTVTLHRADSLFQQKKFTEAFKLYDELDGSGVATPSMYLKMAYINEALGNIPEALYYLDKYYLISKNKIVLKKMEDLASKHQLIGYDYSDVEFAENLIRNYGRFINFYLIGTLIILLAILAYQKIKVNKVNRYLALIIISIDFILIFNNLISFTKKYGIIYSEISYIMSAPSSGAQLLTTFEEGNKFNLKRYNDVWANISLNGEEGFIRTNDLLIIIEKQSPILWFIDKIKIAKK